MTGGYGFGIVTNGMPEGRAAARLRAAELSRARNAQRVLEIAGTYGPRVVLWNASTGEYDFCGRDGLRIRRSVVRFWESCGWATLRHMWGRLYRLHIDTEAIDPGAVSGSALGAD